jgi:3-deoxy-D-manno-octulosonic-acid transferase
MSNGWAQQIAFQLYDLGWSLTLPWLRLSPRLAEGFAQRTLKTALPAADIWIQAASVGESFLAVELVKTLTTDRALTILVTTNTGQGYNILARLRENQPLADNQVRIRVGYFPFDKPALMQRAVQQARPTVAVLLETEIWPGLLRALKKNGCRTLIVNGRITAKSLKRYQRWPSIWRSLRPDKILAISQTDADRFAQLFGPNEIEVMPNMKFDRIVTAAAAAGDEKMIRSILPAGIPFVIFASIRQAEEPSVKKMMGAVKSRRPEAVIGLFPRHIQRLQSWQTHLNQQGFPWMLRSAIATPVSAGTVILWDTFGELQSAYTLAESAFVGGSLAPLGGQNFLEALVSGLVPIIGPWWENFAWVGREIVQAGLLRVAQNWQEAAALILKDMEASQPRCVVIQKGLEFVKARQGGTAQACRHIASCFDDHGTAL